MKVGTAAALAMLSAVVAAAACVVETEPPPLPPRAPSPPAVPKPSAIVAPAPPPAPPPEPAPEAAAPITTAPPPPDSFRTCAADTDCDSVLRNGCCHNGLHEALNKASVAAYAASFTCPTSHPICPMHLVMDRRVPACDQATHQCTLVDPP